MKDPILLQILVDNFTVLPNRANILETFVKTDNKNLDRTLSLIHSLPIKEMEASLLSHAILDQVAIMGIPRKRIAASMELASYLHRKDTRANRANLPRTPYIEHPLRNTLRILRFGCNDEDIIIASILHDTVEDHAPEIVEEFAGKKSISPDTDRAEALKFLREAYGEKVAYILDGVSNPINPPGLTKEEKREIYARHIQDKIVDSSICLVKVSDLIDNAVGLYHNNTSTSNAKMVQHLALKYLPVLNIVIQRLEDPSASKLAVTEDSLKAILVQLKSGIARLKNIIG